MIKNIKEILRQNRKQPEHTIKSISTTKINEFDKEDMTWDIIKKMPLSRYRDKYWEKISTLPCITWEIITADENYDRPWVWSLISKKTNITLEHIESSIIKTSYGTSRFRYPWDWDVLSSSPIITYEFIQKTIDEEPYVKWNFSKLSKNPTLTWDFIVKNLSQNWDWAELSRNPTITCDYISKNITLPWNWNILCRYGNINLDFITQYSYIKWRWDYISQNPIFTLDIIKNNPEFSWNFFSLSERPDLTWDFILQYPPKQKWNWKAIYKNPNLNNNLESVIRKYFAVKVISRYWIRASTTPVKKFDI